MQPDVSVILPVHNRQRQGRAAVGSILAQTYSDFEIVIVDDGSDEPFALAGARDPRIVLVRLAENRGSAAARNAGIAKARGQSLAFLDSDDLWRPTKLETQMAALDAIGREEDVGRVALATGFLRVDARGKPRAAVPISSDDPADFAGGCWFCPGSTVLMPRAAFDRVGPFDESLPRLEDLDWFLRFALSGGRLVVVEEVLAEIGRSGSARPGSVRLAAERMRAKFAAAGVGLPRRCLRRLEAYLALEQSSALWYAGQRLRAGLHLAESMVLVPRTSLALRAFWKAPAEYGQDHI